ncbi:hypothetical protein DPMN_133421 [Dreissena polymorpha]|uniref:Secreted protein n=1 Tax=Dreissena polymorpha TaxID=45954 RepID=A0A9D4FWY9_DREPO|nr:hypothetical protein DPMN_133421 [Dreissena polymorpha]
MLVCLVAACVTGVCGNLHHGFHLHCPGDDALHVDQLADAVSLHLTNGHMLLIASSLEVHLTVNEGRRTTS